MSGSVIAEVRLKLKGLRKPYAIRLAAEGGPKLIAEKPRAKQVCSARVQCPRTS